MKNKKLLFIIGGILFIPLVIVAFLGGNKKPSSTQTATHIGSTDQRAPTAVPTTYEEKLVDRFDNRRPLSDKDEQAKQEIIAIAPDHGSGVLYESTDIMIEYTQLADLIQVEIRTREISKAKEDAVIWLKLRGMSQEGICNAPVHFYPSFDVLQELKQQNIEFNPLAPGC